MSIDYHSHHGFLTLQSIDEVAERLRATLASRSFVLVQCSPDSDGGRPNVVTGCTLNHPITVNPYGHTARSLDFSAGGWSLCFATCADDHQEAALAAEQDQVRFGFDGHVFWISEHSPSGHLHHWVFASEGGGE
ncbi:hypothetical protein AB0J43_02635 [Nonomuraea fuscirosea]